MKGWRAIKWAQRRVRWGMTGHVHTDREVLEAVHDLYKEDFITKVNAGDGRPMIPIDVRAVASSLGMNADMLFGRLYYDLAHRLRVRDPNNSTLVAASLFELKVGTDKHVVNIPYLAAELARQNEQRARHIWTVWLAILALTVSVASAILQYRAPEPLTVTQSTSAGQGVACLRPLQTSPSQATGPSTFPDGR
ncbi:hypothetical protein CXK94_08395 [Stutzerimonas stutzeri]|uniref:Uncharacterized protein n=1 Tax=Stutzerimonas stutzeri TaxID=316 RepID=A0A2N8T652_STUST|nr:MULTISPECIES: hypothetical protein [Pseudomonadaceae]MCQ4325772.1 hypothetical protein [Stutzerimonas stutzeri]PNG10198.1 hypothetical protein CXK94_08395 [Stutzerimonas stutzeri]UIP88217.1 hypothetical protein HU825_17365 [Pseudomonas phenolilytica]